MSFDLDSYVDVAERINRRISVHADGCFVWQGSIGSHGYGQMSVRSRPCLVHRIVYEATRGPIPLGMVLDHLCGRKSCVNPDHLEVVTHAENCRRATGRWTAEQLQDIRTSDCSGGELARKYGTSRGAISNIRTGRTWA